MANKVKFKRSAVPGKIPALNDIGLGELAINTHDGLVYTHKSDGVTDSIVPIGIQGDRGPQGYQGIGGQRGYQGYQGPTGIGFQIVKFYGSQSALLADTAPSGITSSQFAIINSANADNGDLYIWSGGVYSFINKIDGLSGYQGMQGDQGYQGHQGNNGTTFSFGYSAPFDGDGGPGDMYIDLSSSLLYGPKSTIGWGAGNAIAGYQGYQGFQGADGLQGTQGVQGHIGADGSTFCYGYTAPAPETGNVGDMYVDALSGKIYGPKNSNGWGAGTAIAGNQGFQGYQGYQGLKGDQGYQGVQGNQGVQGFQGYQGYQGLTGAQGATFVYGIANPPDTLGNNGDIYINTATGYIFGPKVGDAWPVGTAIAGNQGKQGEQGFQGNQGFKGDTGSQGLVWKDNWDTFASYVTGDVVYYSGSSWYCKIANSGVRPSSDIAMWLLVAEKGDGGVAFLDGGTIEGEDDGFIGCAIDDTLEFGSTLSTWSSSKIFYKTQNPTLFNFSEHITDLGNISGSCSVNLVNASIFTATLSGNCTLSFTGAKVGALYTAMILLKNDNTANRILSITGGKYEGGVMPQRTIAANALDLWSFTTYDGGLTWIGVIVLRDVR